MPQHIGDDLQAPGRDGRHARVGHAIATISRGGIVIVTDDERRENEGDLVMAASLCTPEAMAFVIRHSSGIVCAPLRRRQAQALRLDPMVAANDAPLATAFTVSIDARHGTTTGISAMDRCATVRQLARSTELADFVRPGHVFPLVARDGGVLERPGHTEAAVDLCGLAGLPATGVIGELMNDDGTVMKGVQILEFASRWKLPHIAIEDLIAYRLAHPASACASHRALAV